MTFQKKWRDKDEKSKFFLCVWLSWHVAFCGVLISNDQNTVITTCKSTVSIQRVCRPHINSKPFYNSWIWFIAWVLCLSSLTLYSQGLIEYAVINVGMYEYREQTTISDTCRYEKNNNNNNNKANENPSPNTNNHLQTNQFLAGRKTRKRAAINIPIALFE